MRVKIIVLSFVVNNMYNVVINVVKFVILILFTKKNFFVHSIITAYTFIQHKCQYAQPFCIVAFSIVCS